MYSKFQQNTGEDVGERLKGGGCVYVVLELFVSLVNKFVKKVKRGV